MTSMNMDMGMDVITAGEAMVLFAAQQTGPLENVASFSRTSAGAELNVAMGLARLGLRVGFMSRLGDDAFGQFLMATLKREGIDHRRLAIDAQHRTGFMLKSRSDDGCDPQIEYQDSLHCEYDVCPQAQPKPRRDDQKSFRSSLQNIPDNEKLWVVTVSPSLH